MHNYLVTIIYYYRIIKVENYCAKGSQGTWTIR